MNRHAKANSENEKQLAELERTYHALEAQIGLVILNSHDALQSLSEKSAFSMDDSGDVESFLKLQKDKDDLNRDAEELREAVRHQKECVAELTKLKQLIKSKASNRLILSETLGRAIIDLYTENFAAFFEADYKEISALAAKIEQDEEELREIATQRGLLASIKTTLDRSAKKASLVFAKQKLSKAYSVAGTKAVQNDELKALFDANEISESIQTAYRDMAESEKKLTELTEQEKELERQIKDENDLINTLGISTGAGSAAAKIREIQKEINKAAITERMILSRVGRRFVESRRDAKQEKNPADESHDAFEKDIAPLLERGKILQNEISTCKGTIEKINREIEAAATEKIIASIKGKIGNIEKRIDKLAAEKESAEKEMKLLWAKLSSLRPEE